MKQKIIQQGAEAVLIKRGSELIKRRVEKGYRIKEMDEKIRKGRTKREGKLLEKAGKIVAIPKVIKVDEKKKEIEMEFISGIKLSEGLDDMENWKEVCVAIGENIAKLHDEDIIHGDLTTSNMLWKEGARPPTLKRARLNNPKQVKGAMGSGDASGGNQDDGDGAGGVSANDGKGVLYFIDFGLGFGNGRIEDKAVDLYLIKEALEAKHFKRFEEYFAAVLEGYRASENYKETLKRLEKVEKRGRYKQNY